MGKERIRWCQWECDEKGFKMFKIKSFSKKKISYFLLVFCFFWPARYWEVIWHSRVNGVVAETCLKYLFRIYVS